MLTGVLFALTAGLMWGLVFVGPLLLPGYPAALLSFGRYLAFGLIALPLALADRRGLAGLSRADWWEAAKLSLVGNIVYYLFLASAVQQAGAPLPTMIIGTLPVVIAVCANLRGGPRDARLPWARLTPALGLMAAGIALVNQAEWQALQSHGDGRALRVGAALALGAVVCWTWYPLRNADWLRANSRRSPRTWATAQGLATLPLALAGYAGYALYNAASGGGFAMPLGPTPLKYLGLMLAIGLFASWLGTLCWNEASQRLPTHVSGQLIVFETLAALAYAYALRGQWPGALTSAGIALLVVGVGWGLHARPAPLGGSGAAH